MNIVVISTSSLLTPPTAYAGMERVANLVARGLDELGHDIGVIAKHGSKPQIRGIGVYGIKYESEIPTVVREAALDDWADVFIDISHDKVLPRERRDLKVIECFQAMSMTGTGVNPVLISHGQWRDKFPEVREAEIIYQPIDLIECFPYLGERDNYLLYMGQRIPEKRLEWAMELAIKTNIPLKTYSPGWGDQHYHEMLYTLRDTYPDLISINDDIGGDEKIYTIQHAKALVHPVGGNNWCEAGGIIVLEALACGTPCIVSDNGCLPEYIENGKNGWVCKSVDEMVDALGKVSTISPQDCRDSALRFDYRLAAKQWEKLAQRVASGERWNV